MNDQIMVMKDIFEAYRSCMPVTITEHYNACMHTHIYLWVCVCNINLHSLKSIVCTLLDINICTIQNNNDCFIIMLWSSFLYLGYIDDIFLVQSSRSAYLFVYLIGGFFLWKYIWIFNAAPYLTAKIIIQKYSSV